MPKFVDAADIREFSDRELDAMRGHLKLTDGKLEVGKVVAALGIVEAWTRTIFLGVKSAYVDVHCALFKV